MGSIIYTHLLHLSRALQCSVLNTKNDICILYDVAWSLKYLNLMKQSTFFLTVNYFSKSSSVFKYILVGLFQSSSRVKAFSWKDCGTEAAMVSIKAVSILPDPLSFPGPLTIATNFNIKKIVSSPMKVSALFLSEILARFYLVNLLYLIYVNATPSLLSTKCEYRAVSIIIRVQIMPIPSSRNIHFPQFSVIYYCIVTQND